MIYIKSRSASETNAGEKQQRDSSRTTAEEIKQQLNLEITMPNVLILGGSGYLGTAIAQALLRSGGYAVWGTARTAAKAAQLRAIEVSPVESVDLANPQTLAQAIDRYHIDAVVDASSAYEQAAGVLEAVVTAAKARADTLANDKAIGPKLAFVYTSGSWVHGSPSRRVSDLVRLHRTT